MKIKWLIFGGVGLLLMIILGAVSCNRVSPGYVGIRVNNWGGQKGVEDFPSQEAGYYFVNPFTTSFLEYPTFMQTYVYTHKKNEGKASNEEITFQTRDSMNVGADISIGYTLEASKVPLFYVKFRNDNINLFTHGYLRNVIRDAFQTAGSEFTFDEINGGKKEDFLKKVKEIVKADVNRFGVNIEQLGFIEAVRPPDSMRESINSKVQSIQKSQQSEYELRQSKAEAEKKIAAAVGDAQSTFKRAEGEALANERINRSITPQLLEYKNIEVKLKWDGKQPTTLITTSDKGGTGAIPLINIK